MKELFPQMHAYNLNSQIASPRLILEPINANHADYFFKEMSDPLIYEWISSKPPPSLDLLRSSWLKRESRLSPEHDVAWLNWAIKRLGDNVYVGRIDAEVNIENIATNIGYIFFPSSWGNGYATESVLAVCNHLEKNDVIKIFATVTKGNKSSCRVLEKTGFVVNRVIPDGDTIHGVKYDEIEYLRTI